MLSRWIFIGIIWLAVFAPAAAAQVHEESDLSLQTHHDSLNIFEDQPHALKSFVLVNSETVYVNGVAVDSSQYEIDYRHGHLWVYKDPPGGNATLEVEYQTLPFSFRDVYRRRAVDEDPDVPEDEEAITDEEVEQGRGFSLQHSGSLTRGVRTGSHRDMRIDSGLRMEFSGEVADGVAVRGSLSDEETPIQPDGSTQRLRDVDRVNLQIASSNARMEMGDFDLALNGSHFAQINRRVQGVKMEANDDFGLGYVPAGSELTVAAVQNRGTYREQDIQPIDGVQGPYQLKGSHGERFIVVMAGSERVYLDGQRLQRGDRHDYTIDYATGELWFTAGHLITDDRRMTVEFEYATGEQNRTVVASQARVSPWSDQDGRQRARFGATVLRATDGRSHFGGMMSDEALIPGPDGTMLRSGARSVRFDPEAPYAQYVLSSNADSDSIFVPIQQRPDESDEVYRVRFSRLGEGQGSYVRDDEAVNALRYTYKGEGLGSYSPVAPVPVPQQHQIVDLHGEVEVIRGIELFGEWAQSDQNQNRLLTDPEYQLRGHAYRGGVRVDRDDVMLGDVQIGSVSAQVLRHHEGQNFVTLERTRDVEFGRRWNLPGSGPFGGTPIDDIDEEVRDEMRVEWSYSPRLTVAGELGRLSLPGMYESRRQATEITVPLWGNGEAGYQLDRLASAGVGQADPSSWVRHRGEASTQLFGKRVQPGVSIAHEERLMATQTSDSLASQSFRFTDLRPRVNWSPADGAQLGAELSLRQEERAHNAELTEALQSWTSYATASYERGQTLSLDGRLGYRLRDAAPEFSQYASRALLMRSEIQYRPFERAVDLNIRHEARTERTPVMQELFLRTGPELGEYVWEDHDGDGIMRIDEMIPERTPGEGMYARRMVPTDSLVPVTHVSARLQLHLDPYRHWRGASSAWKELLSAVESRTLVDLNEQTRTLPSARLYLLDPSMILQTGDTQRGRLRLSQDLMFLRRHSGFDLTVGYNQNQSIEDRSADHESAMRREWHSDLQLRIADPWALRFRGSLQYDARESSAFSSRSYALDGWKLRPEVSFQPGSTTRFSSGVHIERLKDRSQEREAFRLSIPLEMRLARAGRMQVRTEADVGHINLKGDATGLSRFQMTDGRGAGTSARWSVIGRYQLTEMLMLSFNYNGLATQETPVRNTFQIELTAQF